MSADDASRSEPQRLPGRPTLDIHATPPAHADHRLIAVGTETEACEAVVFDREDCSNADAKAVVETLARELGVPVEAFRDE